MDREPTRIVEISQCHGLPIYAFSDNGREKKLTPEKAAKLVEILKSKSGWVFCPFDDVVMDYRFKRQ